MKKNIYVLIAVCIVSANLIGMKHVEVPSKRQKREIKEITDDDKSSFLKNVACEIFKVDKEKFVGVAYLSNGTVQACGLGSTWDVKKKKCLGRSTRFSYDYAPKDYDPRKYYCIQSWNVSWIDGKLNALDKVFATESALDFSKNDLIIELGKVCLNNTCCGNLSKSCSACKLILGLSDGVVSVRSYETGEFFWEKKGHDGPVYHILSIIENNQLISGGKDGMINLWNFNTGEILYTFKAYNGQVNSLSLSPDKKELVTCGSDDGVVQTWDLDKLKEWSEKLSNPDELTAKQVTMVLSYLENNH